jgi:hypothetical protein
MLMTLAAPQSDFDTRLYAQDGESRGKKLIKERDLPDQDIQMYMSLFFAGVIPKMEIFAAPLSGGFISKIDIPEYTISSSFGDMDPLTTLRCSINRVSKELISHQSDIEQIYRGSTSLDVRLLHSYALLILPHYQSAHPEATFSLVVCKQGPYYKGHMNLNGQMIGQSTFGSTYNAVEKRTWMIAATYLMIEDSLSREKYYELVRKKESSISKGQASPIEQPTEEAKQKIDAKEIQDQRTEITLMEEVAKQILERPLKKEARKRVQNSDNILLEMDEYRLDLMQHAIDAAVTVGVPTYYEEQATIAPISAPGNIVLDRQLSLQYRQMKSRHLLQHQQLYNARHDLAWLHETKQKLPMRQQASGVLDVINSNVFSIIVGATGSGKSTQTPQIILEDAVRSGKGGFCDIICTQVCLSRGLHIVF